MYEGTVAAAHHSDWVLMILTAVVFLWVLAYRVNGTYFRQFARLPFYVKAREWSAQFNPLQGRGGKDIILGLSGYVIFSLGLFLFTAFREGYRPLTYAWPDFLRVLLLLGIILLFKALLSALVGYVFDCSQAIVKTQNQYFAFLSWSSLPLLPVILVLLLWPSQVAWLYSVLLVFLSGGALLAIGQTLPTTFKIPPSRSYNIFYLCTLEISPVFYLIYLLQNV